jgi:hypothetical protein
MGYKKYEIKITFVIDDYVEDAVNQVEQMKKEIESGLFQRELITIEGFTNIKSTFKQIK